jgi:hypothetical protein
MRRDVLAPQRSPRLGVRQAVPPGGLNPVAQRSPRLPRPTDAAGAISEQPMHRGRPIGDVSARLVACGVGYAPASSSGRVAAFALARPSSWCSRRARLSRAISCRPGKLERGWKRLGAVVPGRQRSICFPQVRRRYIWRQGQRDCEGRAADAPLAHWTSIRSWRVGGGRAPPILGRSSHGLAGDDSASRASYCPEWKCQFKLRYYRGKNVRICGP